MNFISRAVRVIKRDRLNVFVVKVCRSIYIIGVITINNARHGRAELYVKSKVRKLLSLKSDIVKAKEKVLLHLLNMHKATVAYGPFKGMKLSQDVWWGKFDLSTKMLGVYEHHVLSQIVDLSATVNGPFVDVGAADGYFAIGVAKSELMDKVYAYEISEKGRQSLRENALLNNCLDRVIIDSEANYDSLAGLLAEHRQALFLIDIEGAEYGLLNNDVLSLLRNSTVIVELHPWIIEGGYEMQEALLSNVDKWFDARFIERKTYNPNEFEELLEFSDDERLLAFSEGRVKLIQWLVLTPKVSN